MLPEWPSCPTPAALRSEASHWTLVSERKNGFNHFCIKADKAHVFTPGGRRGSSTCTGDGHAVRRHENVNSTDSSHFHNLSHRGSRKAALEAGTSTSSSAILTALLGFLMQRTRGDTEDERKTAQKGEAQESWVCVTRGRGKQN